jgi:tetratricopeptide (TPR) repeat protein
MTRALFLALCLVTTTAHADVWQRAIDTTDSTKVRFEAAMQAGDQLAQRAGAKAQTASMTTSLIDQAIRAYREAATVVPTSAEPYFRIASVLESFFTDCEPRGLNMIRPQTCPSRRAINTVRTKETVDAWDEFEKRAPLDPRVGEALFSRAILRTKLVETSTKDAKVHLEGAMRDYAALLDRADGLTMVSMEQVWGNLAETYMMLGKLEESIEAYSVAIGRGASSSTFYGKAVALDRDEREAEALELIRAQGVRAFQEFRNQFAEGDVFFVPRGEEFYYFALIHEAFGYVNEAIANWRLFIKSGAHPVYQPRAKAHLDALLIKQKTNPRPPPRPDLNDYFSP